MMNQLLEEYLIYFKFELMLNSKLSSFSHSGDLGPQKFCPICDFVLNECCVELILFNVLMYISWCLSRDDIVECGNISAGLV